MLQCFFRIAGQFDVLHEVICYYAAALCRCTGMCLVMQLSQNRSVLCGQSMSVKCAVLCGQAMSVKCAVLCCVVSL